MESTNSIGEKNEQEFNSKPIRYGKTDEECAREQNLKYHHTKESKTTDEHVNDSSSSETNDNQPPDNKRTNYSKTSEPNNEPSSASEDKPLCANGERDENGIGNGGGNSSRQQDSNSKRGSSVNASEHQHNNTRDDGTNVSGQYDNSNTTSTSSKRSRQRSKRPKGKSANHGVKVELKSQLSKYINDERRLLGFDCSGTSPRQPDLMSQRSTSFKRSNQAVSPGERKRLSKYANRTLKQLDLDQIWKFHEFRIGVKQPKSSQNGFVQNYSRHIGNILHSVEYKQLYDQLASRRE